MASAVELERVLIHIDRCLLGGRPTPSLVCHLLFYIFSGVRFEWPLYLIATANNRDKGVNELSSALK